MRVLKWIAASFVFLVTLGVAACSTVGLPRVDAVAPTTIAEPDLLAPMNGEPAITTAEAWEKVRAPYWKNLLLEEVYGSVPPRLPVTVRSDTVIDPALIKGKARLRAVTLQFGDDTSRTLDLHIVEPVTKGPHPIILGAGFCPNHSALQFDGVEPPANADYPGFCDGTWAFPIFELVFGRYAVTPPLEKLIDQGIAFAAYYPAELVADSSEKAPSMMVDFPKSDMEHGDYASIGIWAWAASQLIDYLETDPALDASRTILFGHSRYGKSSLLAGVLDKRVAAVISHQSGTGGASLQKNNVGETIENITTSYPHWFNENYSEYIDHADDMPFDQHALVALMAPRPLMLGNSARDKWSDPKGAFASAEAASKVYELYGVAPFSAGNLKDFDPEAVLAYNFREGTHGITPEDWGPFLEWLSIHID